MTVWGFSNRLRFAIHMFLLPLTMFWFVAGGLSAQAKDGDDTQGLDLEISIPGFATNEVTLDGQHWQRITVPEYGSLGLPGWPALPERRFLVGIPAEATVKLEVTPEATEFYRGLRIAPAPRQRLRQMDPLAEFPSSSDLEWDYSPDPTIYSTDRFLPESPAELGEIGWLRDQRFVEVVIHPAQYNPVTQELRYHRRLHIRLRFEGGILATALSAPAEGPFEPLLRNALVNYEQARRFRHPPLPSTSKREGKGPREGEGLSLTSTSVYKVFVNRTGIYRLTYADLQNAGLPVGTLDPRTFRMFDGGNGNAEVALWVTGESDGRFDPEDAILFYGRAVNTRYTGTNVYWLRYGGSFGLRWQPRNGSPTGRGAIPTCFPKLLHREENHWYRPYLPMQPGVDHWYWDYVQAQPNQLAFKTYTVTVSAPAIGDYMATLLLSIWGVTKNDRITPDHHVRIYVNRHLVQDARWDGTTELLESASFPQSYLMEGTNEIRIELPGDVSDATERIALNWFQLTYYRTFNTQGQYLEFSQDQSGTWEYRITGLTRNDPLILDITDPLRPARIEGAVMESSGSTFTARFEDIVSSSRAYAIATPDQFLSPAGILADTPSTLRNPPNGADYLIISHANFLSAIQPLAAHRAAQGLRVQVIDVQDIYDEFNGGLPSAEAIRDFLAYAYANWPSPAPTYVLLVGDGTFDMRDYMQTGVPTFIPPYLELVDPWLGETAADNRFVTIVGNDPLPDMAIGRLPVNSPAEATVIVNKILTYENNILTYENNSPLGDWNQRLLFVSDNPDDAGDFYFLSDRAADRIPSSYRINKVYYGQTHTTEDDARKAIVSSINAGQLFVNYVGHGSPQSWAREGLLRLMYEVQELNNENKLPVMLPMTCWEGYFVDPRRSSLAEGLVRYERGGAIASWSATGLGLAVGHDYLNIGFYDAVFWDNTTRLGLAIIAGKLHLYNSTALYRDLIDTYTLLGDPALRLALPRLIYLPLIKR
ncbi:MAG: C25 family cysteine peptidase [Anaerolineae bacterium]|nr:C25 family cysteine peptidase [Anaerolineae bacterium]